MKSASKSKAETIIISEVSSEPVALNKGIRNVFGISIYLISVGCDIKSEVNYIKMNRCNKLNAIEDKVEEFQRRLAIREQTGKKVPISNTEIM